MTSDTTQLTIGSDVWCNDRFEGKLQRVVVEPIDRVLTHLVVLPDHGRETERLVPIDLVDATASEAAGVIRLSCTDTEFDTLEDAQETQFLPGAAEDWGYAQEQMLSWPYYGIRMGAGMGIAAAGSGIGRDEGLFAGPQEITRDRVPVGEVQVRRGQHVHAEDGDIGRVQGLVVDRADHHVTHVLLDEGHLWGHKRVAIPIGSVSDVDDGVRLNLSKDEVRDLPPVDLDEQR
jgi:sporulation protein YlmC with PRC-barrel domain